MTAQCPICRSPVEVEDNKIGPDGLKVTCPLCDEQFTVRSASAAPPPVVPAPGGTRSATPSHGSSASRRLLEEDSDGAPPRILVAHDSHVFGEIVRALLDEEGFEVQVVHDGIEAMHAIETTSPAVAILEAALPRKFGFQVVAEVRAMADPPPIKLLLVASIYDRKRLGRSPGIDAAPDDFLEPRNVELELLPKVKRLLRGREGTGSRAAAPASTRSLDLSQDVPPRPPEVVAPPPRKRKDPTHPTHPTMGEEDFADLFVDSSSGPSARPEPPADGPIEDVDAFLASELPGVEADEPPDMSPSAPARARPMQEPPAKALRIGDEPRVDSDEREIWDRMSEEPSKPPAGDDDELLRTLMEMASGDERAGTSSGDSHDGDPIPDPGPPARSELKSSDLGLDFGFEDEPIATPAPPEEPLSSILDQVSGPKTPSEGEGPTSRADGPLPDDVLRVEEFLADDLARDRAPAAGPEELPSRGSLPVSWKATAEDRRANTDDVALARILEGDGPLAENSDDSELVEDDAVERPESEGITHDDMSGLEAGDGIFEDEPRPKNPRAESSRPTDKILDRDGDDARGAIPAAAGGSEPTVLKNGSKPKSEGKSEGKSDGESGLNDADRITEDLDGIPASKTDDDLLSASSLSEDLVSTQQVPRPNLDAPASNGGTAPPGDEHAKARRLAKLIVGDILLYNAEKIPDAVRTGTFFDVMKGDIKDGRDFYDEKVPEDIRSERDYIQELLEETLQNKKKELGLA